MIHQIIYKDKNGDVEEVEWFCTYTCARPTVTKLTSGLNDSAANFESGGVPVHPETDYDVHCGGCGQILWEGLKP